MFLPTLYLFFLFLSILFPMVITRYFIECCTGLTNVSLVTFRISVNYIIFSLCNLYRTCNHYCTILTNALQNVRLSNKYIHYINFFTLNFVIVCQTFISFILISYGVVHILILLYCIGRIENSPKIKCFMFQKYKTKRFWKCACNCNCSENLKNRDLIIYRRITFVVKYLMQFLLPKVDVLL